MTTPRFLVKRLAQSLITLWILSLIVFLGGQLLPGDVGRGRSIPPRMRLTRSAISVYSLILRGLPINAGWNSKTAASVVTSDKASSLPMLDVPGWLDSHRLPNAVAVVRALKKIARVRLVCSRFVLPERQAVT